VEEAPLIDVDFITALNAMVKGKIFTKNNKERDRGRLLLYKWSPEYKGVLCNPAGRGKANSYAEFFKSTWSEFIEPVEQEQIIKIEGKKFKLVEVL
jgi:hypothetical protein